MREKDYPIEVVELKGSFAQLAPRYLLYSCLRAVDTVSDFSWEPKGERFAIISTSDPNYGNPGPGITIKTDVSFYQLVRGKGDFKLLRTSLLLSSSIARHSLISRSFTRDAAKQNQQHHPLVPARPARRARHRRLLLQVRARVLGPRLHRGRDAARGRALGRGHPAPRHRGPLRRHRRRVGPVRAVPRDERERMEAHGASSLLSPFPSGYRLPRKHAD